MNIIEIEKSCSSEYCNWPERIIINIDKNLRDKIEEVKDIIKGNKFINHISIELPTGMIIEKSENELQKICAYDVSYITVGLSFVCLYIQGKYDSFINAEYSIPIS